MMSPRTLVRNKTSVVGEFLLFLVMLGGSLGVGKGEGERIGKERWKSLGNGDLWEMGRGNDHWLWW